jgi:hypothetical protein
MPTPKGHRVIGIKHTLKELREGHGLLIRGIAYPEEAAVHIKSRGAARVQRNVNRTLRLVAQAMKTGKLPPSLATGVMGVRVGNETILIEIDVPEAIRALAKRRR